MKISHASLTFNNSQAKINNTIIKNDFATPQNTTFKGVSPKCVETVMVVPESAKSKFFIPIKKFFKPLTDSYKKGMDNLTTTMAKGLGEILNLKPVENFIDKTKNWDLVSGLTIFTSVVLSGFYMKKTLENKDLDEQRRKTLAINQGAVWALSTVLSLTCNKALKSKIDKFTDNFMKANTSETTKNLEKYKIGIKAASSMMIFGLMYRFIAPVAVTPIANHIGNKMQEKKEAEKLVGAYDKQH